MLAASRHRATVALSLIAMALAAPAVAHAASPCANGAGESVQVASVSSFNTLLLTGGREIMLAGIEIPAGDNAAARASASPARPYKVGEADNPAAILDLDYLVLMPR